MKKKQLIIKYTCPKCDWVNEPDKDKSNANWTVLNCICDRCGTRCKMEVINTK